MLDPASLPQSALDHLWPFVLLAALSVATLIGIIKILLGARTMVREESVAALTTDAGKAAIRGVVAEAITPVAENLESAINDQARTLREHGSAIDRAQASADAAHRRLDQILAPNAPRST
jgi:hypothetical protein